MAIGTNVSKYNVGSKLYYYNFDLVKHIFTLCRVEIVNIEKKDNSGEWHSHDLTWYELTLRDLDTNKTFNTVVNTDFTSFNLFDSLKDVETVMYKNWSGYYNMAINSRKDSIEQLKQKIKDEEEFISSLNKDNYEISSKINSIISKFSDYDKA